MLPHNPHNENMNRLAGTASIEAFRRDDYIVYIYLSISIFIVYLEDELPVLLQQLLEGVGLGLDNGLERLPLLVQLVLQRVDDLHHTQHQPPNQRTRMRCGRTLSGRMAKVGRPFLSVIICVFHMKEDPSCPHLLDALELLVVHAGAEGGAGGHDGPAEGRLQLGRAIGLRRANASQAQAQIRRAVGGGRGDAIGLLDHRRRHGLRRLKSSRNRQRFRFQTRT